MNSTEPNRATLHRNEQSRMETVRGEPRRAEVRHGKWKR